MSNVDKYGPVVRRAFAAVGLPVEWGMAIAHVETGGTFNPGLRKMSGGDGALGGAWGLCQMTLDTAKRLGYDGDGEGLLEPRLNAGLAAELCVCNMKAFGKDLRDVASGYNSGKPWARAKPEVKHYAELVVDHARIYGKLFGHENIKSTEPEGSEKEK